MKKNKLIMYLTFIIVIIGFYILNKNGIRRADINVENIQKLVDSLGTLGILIYILLNCIRPFLLIPTTVFFISGGIVFGFIEGSIYTFLGIIISSTLSFKVSRIFQNRFRRVLEILKLEKYIYKIKDIDDNRIIKRLFFMRITPAFPFDPISFGAGVCNIDYNDFILGTILGVLPKILFYSFMGSYLDYII
ncbi:TVP38/TMEM64 family protein [Clostridium sp. D2Q-14]|uniref:TVP38/TMEM64 family protein n=1 Tax=Anaeromonas gelatinilytica TaxID=2683194 RepID=UPI00193C3BBB|nr:VTT domain-containing protein [Anaeromonas gelatinilytica]MBS4535810.1 TVP38/TMEM64 family protein [Anaeromonas gelatinilytica]